MVHRYAPLATVRRTVTRATRPALVPLRAAVSTLPDAIRPSQDAPRSPSRARLDELEELRGQLAVDRPGDEVGDPADRAQRATRSASAYLEARRARLKRELAELDERG